MWRPHTNRKIIMDEFLSMNVILFKLQNFIMWSNFHHMELFIIYFMSFVNIVTFIHEIYFHPCYHIKPMDSGEGNKF